MKKCCDLNLGESLCTSTFFLFQDSGLKLLNVFDFWFWSILNGVTLKTSNWIKVGVFFKRDLFLREDEVFCFVWCHVTAFKIVTASKIGQNHTMQFFFLRPTRKPTNLEVRYLIQVTESLTLVRFIAIVYDLFYCNVLTSKITAEATCVRFSCYPTRTDVSSMSLPGWLWRIWFEDRAFRKKIDIFVCEMNVYGAILAKTFCHKRAMSCFSSPVSAVYAWNAWDHDPPFGEENGCILWLGLSYGSPSNNDNHKLTRTLFFMIIVIPTSRTCCNGSAALYTRLWCCQLANHFDLFSRFDQFTR